MPSLDGSVWGTGFVGPFTGLWRASGPQTPAAARIENGDEEGMPDNQNDGRLTECLTTVRTLEEENRQLRQSADSFGQLAERLNKELARERRSVDTDRRREPRGGPERCSDWLAR